MKLALTLFIVMAVLFAAWGVETWCDRYRPHINMWLRLAMILGVSLLVGLAGLKLAHPRDLDGRYAQSPLKSWFDHLASGKGLCCSLADGETVADPDWDSKGGHYRVRLGNEWIDVPDDALITEPNKFGRTMVWPLRGSDGLTIRCFMPGIMT